MNFLDPVSDRVPGTIPFFKKYSIDINKDLRNYDSDTLKRNMNLSDNLLIKVEKIITNFTGKKENGRQAIFTYKGAVFKGIDIPSLNIDNLQFAQNYFRIISAHYGILKPFDLIEEYRLDFKANFKTLDFSSLYNYWKKPFIDYFSITEKPDLIINLLSAEFSKAITFKKLNIKVINLIFGEIDNNTYKSPPMYSKMARGRMAGFIIREFITKPEDLKNFNLDGYRFNKEFSNDNKFVFTRSI